MEIRIAKESFFMVPPSKKEKILRLRQAERSTNHFINNLLRAEFAMTSHGPLCNGPADPSRPFMKCALVRLRFDHWFAIIFLLFDRSPSNEKQCSRALLVPSNYFPSSISNEIHWQARGLPMNPNRRPSIRRRASNHSLFSNALCVSVR